MLTNARNKDGAFWCCVAQFLETELRLQCFAGLAWFVRQRKLFAPTADAAAPWGEICLLLATLHQIPQCFDHGFNHQTAVTNNWHVWLAYFALLGRVDVDVDDLCFRSKRIHAASNPVVETCAKRNQQVALLHCGDCGCRSVHARHAQAQRMIVGECTACHQCCYNRSLQHLGKFAQRRCCTGF